MKILSTVLFGILLSAVTAFARLGETPDQCQMRYGTSNAQKGAYAIYYKDHFDIAVMFRDGKSIEEIFTPNMGAALSEEKIAEILSANSGGATWSTRSNKPSDRSYSRSDGLARASFEARARGQSLTIREITKSKIITGKQTTSGF